MFWQRVIVLAQGAARVSQQSGHGLNHPTAENVGVDLGPDQGCDVGQSDRLLDFGRKKCAGLGACPENNPPFT